jgi:HSP20 family protein
MTTTLSTRVARGLQPRLGRQSFVAPQQHVDDLFSRFQTDGIADRPFAVASRSVDLSETDDAVQICMDVPGSKAHEIVIEFSGNTIRISGQHEEQTEEIARTFHRRERRSGPFACVLALPAAVTADHAIAACSDGVLTIILHKTKATKTRKIDVKFNGM